MFLCSPKRFVQIFTFQRMRIFYFVLLAMTGFCVGFSANGGEDDLIKGIGRVRAMSHANRSCGAHVLWLVLSSRGIEVGLSELKKTLDLSPHKGVSIEKIIEISELYGIPVHYVEQSGALEHQNLSRYNSDDRALALMLDQGEHLVFLESWTMDGGAWVIDSLERHYLSDDELAKRWQGKMLLFGDYFASSGFSYVTFFSISLAALSGLFFALALSYHLSAR